MPKATKSKVREARSVEIRYRNPAVVGRRGNLAVGTVDIEADNVHIALHTVYGAAKILRRSPVRVQQLCDNRQLRAHKIGRDWIILDMDLKQFIRAQGAKIRSQFGAFLGG